MTNEEKIVLIDKQGVHQDRVFNNREELKLDLIEFHSIDCEDVTFKDENGIRPIEEATLDEICNFGNWEYKLESRG